MSKKIWIYIIIMYSISWLFWLPILINVRFGAAIPVLPGQFFMASVGPLAGAVLTTLITGGRGGLREWIKRTYSLRVNKNVWLVVIGLPVLYFIVSVVVQRILFGFWPAWNTFGQTDKLPGLSAGLVFLVFVATFGLGEESGWRGFLLLEFNKKFSLVKSALLVSIVWMLWHLPAFFFNPNYRNMGFAIVGWIISLMYGSILLTWIARESRWSIVPVMVWHGGFDLITSSDQSAQCIAMVASLLVILHGIYLSRVLAKDHRLFEHKNSELHPL